MPTYLIRVTNCTFPAMKTLNQVSLVKSFFRRATINHMMKTKLGANIKVTIQLPHHFWPFCICSFPTMISPMNITDPFSNNDYTTRDIISQLNFPTLNKVYYLLTTSYMNIINDRRDFTNPIMDMAMKKFFM